MMRSSARSVSCALFSYEVSMQLTLPLVDSSSAEEYTKDRKSFDQKAAQWVKKVSHDRFRLLRQS